MLGTIDKVVKNRHRSYVIIAGYDGESYYCNTWKNKAEFEVGEEVSFVGEFDQERGFARGLKKVH